MKLTNTICKSILGSIISDAFDKREEKIKEDYRVLADKVYNDVYTKDMQERMKLLPKGFLIEDVTIVVAFDGGVVHLCYGEDRRVADQWSGRWKVVKDYPPKHNLCRSYQSIKKRYEALKKEKKEAVVKAKAVLYNCTTDKRLIEVWPEIKKTVREHCNEPAKAMLPAVRIEDLNRMLGIKS